MRPGDRLTGCTQTNGGVGADLLAPRRSRVRCACARSAVDVVQVVLEVVD
ncbi:hypothetical protein FM105_03200 [Brevibacterium yomogidense]|uniref:Uncharacterized protein n=1 Tax=Brevibacterium yomogidense TaxID=946573 RepID=A0A1X6X1U8_9MICO|nr:hypothetical protein FM105_03200 [Brevibacterium yomogidense]